MKIPFSVKIPFPLFLAGLILIGSCEKVTTATSGKYILAIEGDSTRGVKNFGVEDANASTFKTICQTPEMTLASDQATIDESYNYYTTDSVGNYLIRINVSNISKGNSETIKPPTGSQMTSVVYSPVTKKLYGIDKRISASNSLLYSFSINESAPKTATIVDTFVIPHFQSNNCISSTAHTTQPWIFIGYKSNIIKVNLATGTVETAYTDTSSIFLGISYNSKDDKIYGVRKSITGGTESLISLAATTNAFSVVRDLSYTTNIQKYSAIIDPDENKYIITQQNSTGQYLTNQIILNDHSEKLGKPDPPLVKRGWIRY